MSELYTTLQYALKYHELGFSIAPLEPKKKTPLTGFDLDKYFNQQATKDALVGWFDNTANNIAIITGAISKIFALDIDGERAGAYLQGCMASLRPSLQQAIQSTMSSKTGNGGYHLIFRYNPEEFKPEGLKTKKLWIDPTRIAHSEIAIKAEGGYIVAPPSIHPDTGRPYVLSPNRQVPITLSKEEIEELLVTINPKLKEKPSETTDKVDPLYNNKLTPEKMAVILEILRPYYVKGQRDAIVFALSGYLRKQSVPRDNTKRLIYALCEKAEDEEKTSRLLQVERTYNKAIDKITGFTALLDNLRLQTDDRTALDVMAELKDVVEKDKPIQPSELSRQIAKMPEPDLVEEATLAIMEEFTFLTSQEDGLIFYYKDGRYLPGGEVLIEATAERLYAFRLTNADLTEIKGHIMRQTYIPKGDFDKDLDLIPFKNGIYHISTGELTPHSPEYKIRMQLPYDYNKDATSPLFEKFLSEVLYPEDIDAMLDAMAYSFYRKHIIDIINILLGGGHNGKSVLLEVLEELHGADLTSHTSLFRLAENTFAKADLEGKNINITTETHDIDGEDVATFKELTSKKPQRIERKGVQAYDAILHAKLWTAANEFPHFRDNSDGMIRRLNVFEFPNQFEGEKADPALSSKLTTPDNLAGIFNLLAPRIKKIAETWTLTLARKTIADRREQILLASDPVRIYSEEHLTQASDYVLKSRVYEHFKTWCRQKKIHILSEEQFGKEMKRLGWKDARPRIDGKQTKVWQDMAIVEDVNERLV
jgi:putative DNA primase/helicase